MEELVTGKESHTHLVIIQGSCLTILLEYMYRCIIAQNSNKTSLTTVVQTTVVPPF